MQKVKIVSWNIAGGRPINSLEQFDYSSEDINYFIQKLQDLDPDIICLQESHTNDTVSNAQKIADKLGMQYVFNTPNSPSHIDSGYQLSLAILSKIPFTAQNYYQYPDPSFKLLWKDGTEADTYHKGLQVVKIGDFNIANTQMLPINIWGYSYDKESGLEFSDQINQILKEILETPLIFCGDFNYDNPKRLYHDLFEKLGLIDALPEDQPTRPTKNNNKKTPDHIFYSKEFKLVDSKIIQTNTDHYLCFSEFNPED